MSNNQQNKKFERAAPVFPGDAAESIEVSGADAAARKEVKKHGWSVLAILSALMGFASISTDLYLPAMPEMSLSLGVSPGVLAWTISGYLIGFSLGQLLWGPIGDRYGRRLPIAIGLLLFIIGSAGCALSVSAVTIIFWRVVQAVGACAGVVLARAMVRDLYKGERANEMMSMLMVVMAIAPLLGPMVGGQILTFFGWRAIFWTLVVIGVATLAALTTLPETLPSQHRNFEPLSAAMARYGQLLANRRLLTYAGVGGFFYGGIYAYIAGTPFAYITYHHVPQQYYGLLFGIGIIGIMITNFLNAKLVSRIGGTKLLQRGSAVAAITAILLAVAAHTDLGGLWGLVIPSFIFISMSGFVLGNSIAGALENFPARQAGAVSALVGALQYGSGIFGSALVGIFADGTPWPLGVVIGIAGIGSFICARLLAR